MVHTLLEHNVRWFDFACLGLLLVVSITLVYAIIYIHDIPYEIAKKRNHPQRDAIHTAGWVSLFLMHSLWPFLWIWATLNKPEIDLKAVNEGLGTGTDEPKDVKKEIELLKEKLSSLESMISPDTEVKDKEA